MYENFKIRQVNAFSKIPSAASFVKKNHYLHSLSRGNKFVYVLYINGKISGVAAFGQPVSLKYNNSHWELKRFVLKEGLKTNTGSWFMSKCFKLLKLCTDRPIITYADPSQGHEGILYKAANFQYLGKQPFATMVYKKGKKLLHGRSKVAKISEGGKWVAMPKKYIFEYKLKGR